MGRHLDRRRFLQTLATAAGGAAVLGLHPTYVHAADRAITITSLGGKWEQWVRQHVIPRFKEKTGADVKVVLGGSPQWMAQIEAQPKNPPLDHIDNSETLAYSLIDKGLVAKLTADKVTNIVDIADPFRKPWDDFGVLYQYAAAGIVYNREKIKTPPKTWREFFERTASGEFGRNVSVPDITYGWTPHFVWLYAKAHGGDINNLEPGWAALKKIKPYVTKFWIHAVEFEKMASTRDIDIGIFWDGRSHTLIDGGAKFLAFQRPEADSLISAVVAQAVKSGNEALALEYVNTLLDPEAQLEYFKLINYAVTNRKVVYPAHLKDRIMPPQLGVTPPYRELAKATSGIIDRWNREIKL